jgi:DnaJ family protein C protein 9
MFRCFVYEYYLRQKFSSSNVKHLRLLIQYFAGSAEELCEIREAYEKSKGDLMKIILNVMCATYDDEARFTTIINKLIADGDVQPYKQFTNESDASKAKRRKWFELEAKVRAFFAFALCFPVSGRMFLY